MVSGVWRAQAERAAAEDCGGVTRSATDGGPGGSVGMRLLLENLSIETPCREAYERRPGAKVGLKELFDFARGERDIEDPHVHHHVGAIELESIAKALLAQ